LQTERLRELVRGRAVVLGVGNALRADDAAGPLVAETLRRSFPGFVFDAGQAPENFVGPVARARPETIVIVDAADFGGQAGEIRIAAAGDVGGAMLGTHGAPLGMFMRVAVAETGASACLIAIQVKSTALGDVMSDEVRRAASDVAAELKKILEGVTE
jgi:hydrogenase 3 maturation protease